MFEPAKIDWETVAKYDVVNVSDPPLSHPATHVVGRRLELNGAWHWTPLHGPFVGAVAGAAARAVANALNAYTLTRELLDVLTPAEMAFLATQQAKPPVPIWDDDDIPF